MNGSESEIKSKMASGKRSKKKMFTSIIKIKIQNKLKMQTLNENGCELKLNMNSSAQDVEKNYEFSG